VFASELLPASRALRSRSTRPLAVSLALPPALAPSVSQSQRQSASCCCASTDASVAPDDSSLLCIGETSDMTKGVVAGFVAGAGLASFLPSVFGGGSPLAVTETEPGLCHFLPDQVRRSP
jgi:hypothetical protein